MARHKRGEAMPYDKHIFISYCHLDNQALTSEQEGWVSRFHDALEKILTMRLGRKAQIWRDKKLRGNDSFEDEIVAQLPKTEILVSIVSKCYANSDACRREFEEFCRRAGEIRVGNKYRIVKVIKLPVDRSLPPPMDDMLGYEFFTYKDKDSDHPLELDPVYFPKLAPLYIEKLYVLADDVIDLIKRMEASANETDPVPQQPSSRPQVFLAECSSDQKEAREALRMTLRQFGYTVLPDRPLPKEEAAFASDVSHFLDQCSLAVHLVGGSPGWMPDGPSRKTAVVLQNELAIEQSKKRSLPRIIWLPEGTTSNDAAQQTFIDALRRDADTQFGAELIRDDLEKLKSQIHTILERIEYTENQAPSPPDLKLTYLIYDQKDREAVLPLRKLLKSKGFQVQTPVFEGSAAEVDRTKQEMLALCNAVVVFYGQGDEGWKRAIDRDLLKSKAYRAGKPPFVQITFLSGPPTADKQELIELEEENLVNGLDGLSENAINRLLQTLPKA